MPFVTTETLFDSCQHWGFIPGNKIFALHLKGMLQFIRLYLKCNRYFWGTESFIKYDLEFFFYINFGYEYLDTSLV